MRTWAYILLLLMMISCNFNQSKETRSIKKITVVAHRGASGYLPEHTLASKAMAHAMNADYIEQDIVLSKDDIPIVIHDILLDDVTNVLEKYPNRKREDGKYYVIDFTFEELKKLEVTERFDSKTGLQKDSKRVSLFPGWRPLGASWATSGDRTNLCYSKSAPTAPSKCLWHPKLSPNSQKMTFKVGLKVCTWPGGLRGAI